MNQYGAIAQQHWRRWRPASYAAISDPKTYFTDLGEQAADEIACLGHRCAPRPTTRPARTTSPGSPG